MPSPREQRIDIAGPDENDAPPTPGDDRSKPKSAQEQVLEMATRGFDAFRSRYEKLISSYAGVEGIEFTVKPGGWYIDLENIRVNADPEFFLKKGYGESESLFASFHEMEHFRDMIRNEKVYSANFARFEALDEETSLKGYGKAVSRLYNCVDDILVNRAVMSRWTDGRKAKNTLYPKLFPTAVLNVAPKTGAQEPRHRQFMYALLRKAMLPDETVTVDADVAEAIERCQNRGEGMALYTEALTSVDMQGIAKLAPDERFALMRSHIEPLFLELFKKDLVDRVRKNPGNKPGGDQDGEFDEDPNAGAIPDPLAGNDVAGAAKKINDALSKVKKDAFKTAMGVERADFDRYLKDLKIVEPHVDSLSRKFDTLIDRRIHVRRVLRKPVNEGVMLDPNKAAIAHTEVMAGNTEPLVMVDYERVRSIENRPSEIEFTLVCDGSSSMNEAGKDAMQRRFAVLVVEALALFRDRIDSRRRSGDNIDLVVRSGVRMFSAGAFTLKTLSESLTQVERVEMHKKLRSLPGTGQNELSVFDELDKQEMGLQTLEKLRRGDLKKIVLFLTDGQSDSIAIQLKIRELETKAGAAGKFDPFIIAAIGFGDGKEAKTTYAPNGFFAKDFADMEQIFTEFLSKLLESL